MIIIYIIIKKCLDWVSTKNWEYSQIYFQLGLIKLFVIPVSSFM